MLLISKSLMKMLFKTYMSILCSKDSDKIVILNSLTNINHNKQDQRRGNPLPIQLKTYQIKKTNGGYQEQPKLKVSKSRNKS